MRQKSEINNFIQSMGTTTQIPIVYTQSPSLTIENNGTLTEPNIRYKNGEDIIFQCPKCKDHIGKGKYTNEIEDKSKLYCFNCKQYNIYNSTMNNQSDPLWHKPQNKDQRGQYELLMNEFLKTNPKII
jgi:hypothetical protein